MKAEELVRLLEQRISALEEQNASRSLQARLPLEFVDEHGRPRFRFSASERGHAIELLGDDGQARATLGVDGTGSGLVFLRGPDGSSAASLDVESWGGRLMLRGSEGSELVLFGGEAKDAEAGIHLISSTGAMVALWTNPSGGSMTAQTSDGATAPIATSDDD